MANIITAIEGPEGVWNFYVARRTNAPLGQAFHGSAAKSTLNCNTQTMIWGSTPKHSSWVAAADKIFCVQTRQRKRELERKTREFAEERERLRSQEQSEGLKRSIDDAKTTCKNLGFIEGTEKFGECVLEISGRTSEPTENITRSPVVDECTGFGFEYGTTPYAECKQELAAAKARMQQQQYAAQLEIYESERRRQQGLLLM